MKGIKTGKDKDRDGRLFYDIPIGGIIEFTEWKILIDYDVSTFFGARRCKHSRSVKRKRHYRHDKTFFTKTHWIIPRAIEGFNEGGHNVVIICLDCILEASETIFQSGECPPIEIKVRENIRGDL